MLKSQKINSLKKKKERLLTDYNEIILLIFQLLNVSQLSETLQCGVSGDGGWRSLPNSI
jgi:type IV secretory pathway VirJ component